MSRWHLNQTKLEKARLNLIVVLDQIKYQFNIKNLKNTRLGKANLKSVVN